jgi:hypothetical protein
LYAPMHVIGLFSKSKSANTIGQCEWNGNSMDLLMNIFLLKIYYFEPIWKNSSNCIKTLLKLYLNHYKCNSYPLIVLILKFIF